MRSRRGSPAKRRYSQAATPCGRPCVPSWRWADHALVKYAHHIWGGFAVASGQRLHAHTVGAAEGHCASEGSCHSPRVPHTKRVLMTACEAGRSMMMSRKAVRLRAAACRWCQSAGCSLSEEEGACGGEHGHEHLGHWCVRAKRGSRTRARHLSVSGRRGVGLQGQRHAGAHGRARNAP